MNIKESDIRRRDTFDRFLQIIKEDVNTFFDFASFISISCPACGEKGNSYEFSKLGFHYVTCKGCSTLYVNPRPGPEALREFYSNSRSVDYLADVFFKESETRRKNLFHSKAAFVNGFFGTKRKLTIGDIGAGNGVFLEELRGMAPDNNYTAIEPSEKMAAICKEKSFSVRPTTFENMRPDELMFDCLIAFELVEHLFDPRAFFKKVYTMLRPGGYFFLSTLNCRGFDIAVLWEQSKSVNPPHHLNFFNPGSIRQLLASTGFDVVDISTPGRLDWDIVEGMIINDGVKVDRLWEIIAREGNDDCKRELQKWISNNGLSSHMNIVARKPEVQE